jgi:hypothetical protein
MRRPTPIHTEKRTQVCTDSLVVRKTFVRIEAAGNHGTKKQRIEIITIIKFS